MCEAMKQFVESLFPIGRKEGERKRESKNRRKEENGKREKNGIWKREESGRKRKQKLKM